MVAIVIGLCVGSIYAIMALGIAVIYRGTHMVNFGHGEIGALGVYIFIQMRVLNHANGLVAVILGLLVAGTCGALFGLLVNRMSRNTRNELAPLIASFGVFMIVRSMTVSVWGPKEPYSLPKVWGSGGIKLSGQTVPYSYLGALATTVLLGAVFFLLARFTKVGLQLRAVVANRDAAELAGVPARRLQLHRLVRRNRDRLYCCVPLLREQLRGHRDDRSGAHPNVCDRGGGRLRELRSHWTCGHRLRHRESAARPLYDLRRSRCAEPGNPDRASIHHSARSARGEIREVRMSSGQGRRSAVRIGVFLILAAAVVFGCAEIASSQPFLGTVIATTAVYGIAATGLDFVLGWLREISVAQGAAMAVGAYAGAPLVEHHALLALVVAGAAGLVIGVFIGLPAIRVSGFALATYTLVVGLAIQLLLGDFSIFGGTAGKAITPGTLFGLDLTGVHLVIICVVILILSIAVYYQLMHSIVGLSWRAVGQNHRMASSLAMNPVGMRLAAFGAAGLFGGVAGMLFAVISGYLSPDLFPFTLSVQLLAMVVIGGRVHPLGPAVGAALFAVYQQYLPVTTFTEALIGVILVVSVWLAPKGAVPYVVDGYHLLVGKVIRRGRGGPPGGLTETPVVPAADTASVSGSTSKAKL